MIEESLFVSQVILQAISGLPVVTKDKSSQKPERNLNANVGLVAEPARTNLPSLSIPEGRSRVRGTQCMPPFCWNFKIFWEILITWAELFKS